MMKYFYASLIVIAVLIGMMYVVGMFDPPDPQQAAAEMRRRVQPGMMWTEVVDMLEPDKVFSPGEGGSDRIEDFRASSFREDIRNGRYPLGFWFEYHFSRKDAVQITFSSMGEVRQVSEAVTANDVNSGTFR